MTSGSVEEQVVTVQRGRVHGPMGPPGKWCRQGDLVGGEGHDRSRSPTMVETTRTRYRTPLVPSRELSGSRPRGRGPDNRVDIQPRADGGPKA